MELEVTEKIRAGRYERSDGSTIYRNSCRDRVLEARVERVDLKIPKLREGSYFPSMLKPRCRAERALVSVIQEAYIHGTSTH